MIADEKKLNLVFDFHERDLKAFVEAYKKDEFLDSMLVKVILELYQRVLYIKFFQEWLIATQRELCIEI